MTTPKPDYPLEEIPEPWDYGDKWPAVQAWQETVPAVERRRVAWRRETFGQFIERWAEDLALRR